MELSKEQINLLRKKELYILKTFIEVCQNLNIRYFICQGTLLGAVRHHGFIPWDDDIDVGMLREDYEIFISKGQKLMPPNYFIQTYDTDPAYPHGFAKIRNSNTAFVETTCRNLPINHGIYIDIFPFDYYPDSRIKRFFYDCKKFWIRYRIRCTLYDPMEEKKFLKNNLRKAAKIISKVIYPSVDRAKDIQEQLYKSVRKGKYRINNGSPWGKRECIPAEWLDTLVTLNFEGIEVKAPYAYHEYLTHVYGNYKSLPPPEKRISHHFICAVDFEKAYTDVNDV